MYWMWRRSYKSTGLPHNDWWLIRHVIENNEYFAASSFRIQHISASFDESSEKEAHHVITTTIQFVVFETVTGDTLFTCYRSTI